MPARPRLAFVSPLPPVRSGIADYARDLLPHVARDFDVEVFVDERHPLLRDERYQSLAVRPASELPERVHEFAHVVYQMGNNLHHRFVLDLARELPGVVVLHDVVLHHLYEEIAGREDEWEGYRRALRRSYGEVGDALVRMKRWRLASERENFAFPLFETLGATSRGVLVHSETARREVERRLPHIVVRRIPMGIPIAEQIDAVAARRRLGIRDTEMVVGAFGFLIPTKRLDVLAKGLRRAWCEAPAIRLVLIGEESAGVQLAEIFTADEFRSGRVSHRGYVQSEEYRDWMAATDVAVNLRYPTAGETSASLLRLLGDGKCTLVSAYRQFLEIPAEAVVRVPLGAGEEPTLGRELVALARDPARRRRIGDAARAFVAAEHSMQAAAAGFCRALEEIAVAPAAAALAEPLWRCPRTSRVAAIEGSISLRGSDQIRARPGAKVDLELLVRNDGESRWISTPEPTGGHVGVGADIVGPGGDLVGRIRPTLLGADLDPGEERSVRLRLDTPRALGDYRIQPTLVHFGRRSRYAAGSPLVLAVVAAADSGEGPVDRSAAAD